MGVIPIPKIQLPQPVFPDFPTLAAFSLMYFYEVRPQEAWLCRARRNRFYRAS